MMSESTILVRRDQGILYIEATDKELVDERRIDQFVEEIGQCIESETPPRIVLDLSRVEKVSSTLLGGLVGIHNRVRARQGQLRLAALGERIRHLLVMTHLAGLFEIHSTAERAAASIG